MSSSVAWNMNVKNGAVIKIPTIDVNEAEDNTVLEENNMENAPIVNKETNDSTVIHKDEVQCPPPLSPSTSQIEAFKGSEQSKLLALDVDKKPRIRESIRNLQNLNYTS